MSVSSKNLLDLPIKVLAYTLSLADACTICNASRACKALYEASTWESVWRSKTEREFNLKNLNIKKWTYQHVYKNLLYKYGFTLGRWQCNDNCYGAIFKVEFDEEVACLRCWEILPPTSPMVEDDVRRKLLFVIRTEIPTEARQITCCYRQEIAHYGTVTRTQDGGFEFRCQDHDSNHWDSNWDPTAFQRWVHDEYDGDSISEAVFLFGTEVRFKKFLAARKREYKFRASQFKYGNSCDVKDSMLRPGIFKGTYSVHGLEFVHVSYENQDKLVVRKVTGDENVPEGQITNIADLTRPMVLNRDQQESESLLDIDIPDIQPGFNLKSLPRQPFLVPEGWRSRGRSSPEYCLARFHGQGQIAGPGFGDPSMTPGHWVLFDQDTFGFVWLELRAFGLYCRVKDGEI